MGFNAVAALQLVQDDTMRIMLLVKQQILNPSQSNIDAIIAAYQTAQQNGTAAGVVVPKPSYGLDGESYQWTAYEMDLRKSLRELQELIIMFGGNFVVRSRAAV